MESLAEMVSVALRNTGKLCSVHLDLVCPIIQFQWARVCKTDEEAEMVDCPLQSAAVPGEPYGLRFEGISQYCPDNQDNLQVGYLAEVSISGAPSRQHCVVRFNSPLGDNGGQVAFDFTKWSVLVATERQKGGGQ